MVKRKRIAETQVNEPQLPGVLPTDSMDEAGRKVLAFHFRHVLAEEATIRQGLSPDNATENVDLIEPVHNMRVATRRLRSALQLFGPYLNRKRLKRFRSALREIAGALGDVRDMDVLRLKFGKYIATLPEEGRGEFDSLMGDWESRAGDARQALMRLLNGEAYNHFATTFGQYLTKKEPANPDGNVPQVRYVVAGLIYQQYGQVRAYERGLAEASLDHLHELRIEAKRFRYLVEAYLEVLGPEAKLVINATKNLQDHLGDLQDARVANQIMREYTATADERQSKSAVLHYMAVREAEMHDLIKGAGPALEAFTRPEVRTALALAVSIL